MTDTAELERLAAIIPHSPWISSNDHPTNACAYVRDQDGHDVCTIYEAGDNVPSPRDGESWADQPIRDQTARAIALVPELLAEVIALRAEVERLAEALTSLVELNDEYSPFGGEIYQDRIERTWDRGRQSLAAHTQRVNAKENSQ
ncbi:hypothetical protein SAMN04489859_100879 [Paracoccus alcaliphilus]|uniref:Uncharacterized protein n=1 Tax=Paracoccus alcaliphilus TaxID=34002 RepID=A0A1H8H1K0_9RHOB|nr:hypothetical protein [Paracoccus alcaliphilus]WCR17414.1 hypothetical protein JHW40_13835 [Paracoccus alcaliphilus]SEN50232.1 hypothetical protein SAMN04489859_100879 [Paracoccus alcaliphilus]